MISPPRSREHSCRFIWCGQYFSVHPESAAATPSAQLFFCSSGSNLLNEPVLDLANSCVPGGCTQAKTTPGLKIFSFASALWNPIFPLPDLATYSVLVGPTQVRTIHMYPLQLSLDPGLATDWNPLLRPVWCSLGPIH